MIIRLVCHIHIDRYDIRNLETDSCVKLHEHTRPRRKLRGRCGSSKLVSCAPCKCGMPPGQRRGRHGDDSGVSTPAASASARGSQAARTRRRAKARSGNGEISERGKESDRDSIAPLVVSFTDSALVRCMCVQRYLHFCTSM